MAVEWRASTWGEEISLEYGKALRGYSTEPGKFRVYGSNGPIGWTEQPLAKGPGVILGRKGAYRGVEFSPDPFFVIDTAYYVVPKTELDMRWLYYAIKHHKLGEIDDGSPIPSTTRSAVYVRDLEIPSLPEQKAIAAVLAAMDDKIELNRRVNATLEAMARALFHSWFVAFDPVRAKAEGRHPAGLDEPTAALFPAQFQDSELGEIPQGWNAASLDKIAIITMGLSPKGDSYNANGVGIPLINGPVEFGEYFPEKSKWTTEATRLAAKGDLIFCVRGSTTGRRVISDGEYAIGRGVCMMRATEGRRSFLYQTVSLEAVMNFLQKELVLCKYIGHYDRDERRNQEIPDELPERRERCRVGVLRSLFDADERGRPAAQTLSSGGVQRGALSCQDGVSMEISSFGFSTS